MNEQLILCNRLKEARTSQHLSQAQLAKLALLLCIALDRKFEDLFCFTEATEKKKRCF